MIPKIIQIVNVYRGDGGLCNEAFFSEQRVHRQQWVKPQQHAMKNNLIDAERNFLHNLMSRKQKQD